MDDAWFRMDVVCRGGGQGGPKNTQRSWQDAFGDTALHRAAAFGHTEVSGCQDRYEI